MKKKTEVAVKITDKNREKVRGILDMFGQWQDHDIFRYNYICFCNGAWSGNNTDTLSGGRKLQVIKPKELRNILALDNLKLGDIIVCEDSGDVAVGIFKEYEAIFNFDLDKAYYLNKPGYIGNGITGGCFDNFLRYATEEEKGLLETKKELEVGKWYKGVSDNTQLLFKVDCLNKDVNYGFISNKWYECLCCSRACEWQEATPQEVEKALIEEAERRGYKVGNSKCLEDGAVWDFDSNQGYEYEIENNTLHLDASVVFKNGKWAEIIEVDKLAELKEAHKNGAVIECLQLDNTWYTVEKPNWHDHNEYRIKPKNKLEISAEVEISHIEVNAVLKTTVNGETKLTTHFLHNLTKEDYERLYDGK